ncbi:MAG: DNA-directed RNA polymerase subunit beta' [Mycoplasmoidaceae bacterium]|nr:MAG: DNA-directed RNA polymerase subunit beta' [Mycoplasmoidaceae bacterium]
MLWGRRNHRVERNIMAKKNNQTNIKALQVKLANSDIIRKWSNGEVKTADTISYKNGSPEEGGLFDQKIFGPVKDFQCACGKYKGIRYKGRLCEKCGVEVTKSAVRRERMGHIELPSPIVHTWFFNDLPNPSKISYVLGLDNNEVKSVIYYESYIVIDNGGLSKYFQNNQIITFNEKKDGSRNSRSQCRKVLEEVILPKLDKNSPDLEESKELLEQLKKGDYTFNIDYILKFIADKTKIVFGIGAEAIQKLLANINIDKEIAELKRKIDPNSSDFAKKVQRLKILTWFKNSGNKPEWMVVNVIPVTPPDTRPLMQLQTGNYVSSDINELYRKIIMRCTALRNAQQMDAPDRIIYEQKKNVQLAVDALFDSGSVNSNSTKSFKSITDYLKGKTGLFRQNLLGKRVDYSARSVIVGGPDLKLYEAGIPVEIALKILKPFIISRLIATSDEFGNTINPIADNIKDAEKIIIARDDRIWPIVQSIIKERPVILNRAPSLHKLSISAFEIKLTDGKAIRLHPLVTQGFNADFDGDTMAVHLPLSNEAVNEARGMILSINNLITPKDGKPTISPTIDIPLGIFYLTSARQLKEFPDVIAFSSLEEIKSALLANKLSVQSIIAVSSNMYSEKKLGSNKIILTTAGRVLFNAIMPNDYKLIKPIQVLDVDQDFRSVAQKIPADDGITKSEIGKIIGDIYEKYGNIIAAEIADKIKDIGFEYATKSGITFSVFDFPKYEAKEKYIESAKEKINTLEKQFKKGLLTNDERYLRVIETWTSVKDDVTKDMEKIISDPNNANQSVIYMNKSGARGNLSQFTQMIGMRGLMAKSVNYSNSESSVIKDTIENPILNSFFDGLTIMEYFNASYGGRKSMVDTALKTSKSGYMTRKLVDCAQDVIVKEDDCGATSGIIVSAIKNEQGQVIEKLSERIAGRTSVGKVKDGSKVLVEENQLITSEIAKEIEKAGIQEVEVYSPIKCKCKHGICKKCYGIDISTNKVVSINTPIGIIAAQSIGEPVTQLNMRAKATGGVAGGVQIAQGYERIKQLLDVVDPKESELARISEGDGSVKEIEQTSDYKIITITYMNNTKSYKIPNGSKVLVSVGDKVKLGQKLNYGNFSLKELLKVCGINAVSKYIIEEIQNVYRLQGIEINDKYVEIIIRQMTKNMLITNAGDSDDYFIGQSVTFNDLVKINDTLLNSGKKPVIANNELLGLDSIPSRSVSFLNAASFQYTKKVLINAAIKGQIDELLSLKENVMLGKLIPVGSGKDDVENIILKGEEVYKKEY